MDYKKILLIAVILATVIYIGIKNIRASKTLIHSDRLNIAIYSQTPVFYSLAYDDISYFLPFQADYQMVVPGGYDLYRLGALGKLAYLEKKPDLIRKTFSVATDSFVDIYFYPKSDSIYYGHNEIPSVFPSFKQIFFSVSNASVIDRIVLFYMFETRNKNQYKLITDIPVQQKNNELYFDYDRFFKTYQGFLYDKTLHDQNETIQILYLKNYKTAQAISQILEGEGIRVVDISQMSNPRCEIIDNQEKPSVTGKKLIDYFGCKYVKNQTSVSDIIFQMGNLEKEWSTE